jgi:hypothetical protein
MNEDTMQTNQDSPRETELVYSMSPNFPSNHKIRAVTCPRCKITVKTNIPGPMCAKCKCSMVTEIRPK